MRSFGACSGAVRGTASQGLRNDWSERPFADYTQLSVVDLSRVISRTMGQTPSSRMLQQATELQSDTADRKAADLTHHAMAKQQWKLKLEAKRRALGVELRSLIEEGMQSSFLPSL